MRDYPEKRINFRRYEDRRLAVMFAVYEILFDMKPGNERDEMILKAIVTNFKVDRAAFIGFENSSERIARLVVSVGDFKDAEKSTPIMGNGFDRLLNLHRDVVGALCFESVRKPEAFSREAWESLWNEVLGGSVRALLSMEIRPKKRAGCFIWLQQTGSSREWSSRDRDLIEELSNLLARAWDKDG